MYQAPGLLSSTPHPSKFNQLMFDIIGERGLQPTSTAAIKSIPDSSLEFLTKSYNLPNSQP